jgi:hypothetical protein
MVANIATVQSAHKVFLNGILICYGCYKISGLCHIFKGFITHPRSFNLSGSLLNAFTSRQISLLELNKASAFSCSMYPFNQYINPLNAELNPICHLLALLEAHPILHISRIRVNIISMNQRLKCTIQFQQLPDLPEPYWHIPGVTS